MGLFEGESDSSGSDVPLSTGRHDDEANGGILHDDNVSEEPYCGNETGEDSASIV